jgi:hypothetical protein
MFLYMYRIFQPSGRKVELHIRFSTPIPLVFPYLSSGPQLCIGCVRSEEHAQQRGAVYLVVAGGFIDILEVQSLFWILKMDPICAYETPSISTNGHTA